MSDPDRRAFLRWLAASPLAASLAACADPEAAGTGATGAVRSATGIPATGIPTRPEDALDVFDLERMAEQRIPLSHLAYLQTGVDGEETLQRNREGFGRLHIRPRRLVGVADVELGTELFGRAWPTPLLLAPCGSQRGFHPDGERATARACAEGDHLMVLSSVSSLGIEDVTEARGEPVWFQLYPSGSWDVTEHVVRRAQDAGAPVLVLTVDNPGGANRVTERRGELADPRDCASCHTEGGEAPPVKPMYQGAPPSEGAPGRDSLTWDFVARLRDATSMRLVLKGIMTPEDAALALRYGADGIWVSNHGGRTDPSAQATIAALPDVAGVVGGRVPVVLDSGVRRGADVFKALALGADAVAIGRPYLWGLGAFGQAGVRRTMEILTRELELTMRTAGTPTPKAIGASSVGAW